MTVKSTRSDADELVGGVEDALVVDDDESTLRTDTEAVGCTIATGDVFDVH